MHLPAIYFSKGETHFRVSYYLHSSYHYAVAATELEAAQLLKSIGKISTYSISRAGAVTMYQIVLKTTVGKKGEPVMHPIPKPCRMADIDLTKDEAAHIAALDYWNKAMSKMKGVRAKVINMFNPTQKQIA